RARPRAWCRDRWRRHIVIPRRLVRERHPPWRNHARAPALDRAPRRRRRRDRDAWTLRRRPGSAGARPCARCRRFRHARGDDGGGEEYELLVGSAADACPRIAAGLAHATGTTLTRVGTIERGASVRFVDAQGQEVDVARGFEHFVTGH